MNYLDDYEEGVFTVPVRKHWWQFWLPVSVVAGRYMRMGDVTQLFAFGGTWTGIMYKMENGK